MDLLWYASIAASVLLVYVLTSLVPYLWRKRRHHVTLKRNFPAPAAAHWLLGHVPLLSGLSYETLMLFSRWTKEYPRYYLFMAGPLETKLFLNHADTIKQLTKTHEPKQFGFGGVYRFILPAIGDGILCSSGDKWHRNRKLLTPAFHFDALKGYVPVVNESALKLIDKLEKLSTNTGKSVDLSDPIRLCSLDLVMRTAFSSSTDVQAQGDIDTFVRSIDFMTEQVVKRVITPLYHFDSWYNRTQAGKQFYQSAQCVSDVATAVINQRRLELAQSKVGDNKSTGKCLDFLDRLLMARDEDGNGLSRDDILDEVRTFMIGGHDTTTGAIIWLIYNLAKHRQCQDLAR